MELLSVVVLLGAAVVAVPVFKRLGLGSVIGYLAAGVVIGPSVAGFFNDPNAILSVAELGVVMLLFIIGLELEPSRLWAMRRAVFGLGFTQVATSSALIFIAALLAGLSVPAAIVTGLGLAMSSTAIVMQILDDRGETHEVSGRRIFGILLFQDLAIVPALAAVALLAPGHAPVEGGHGALTINPLGALAAVIGVVAVGRWALNPMFRILAAANAREIMTAAALLVVLGAAAAMQLGGLSMAMGAFLAGVLLSESSFRHELKADIEPFRGLLLGLFFLGVGMSMDLGLVMRRWPAILFAMVAFMALKAGSIYAFARVLKRGHANALRAALVLAEGGEFAFVLFAATAAASIFTEELRGILTAAVILSMMATPLLSIAINRFVITEDDSLDGVEAADGLSGSALLIGFGRFGQVVSQLLLARGTDVSIIDSSPSMIRASAKFGFKIYYGDGTRLDVLRAAGAEQAKLIAVCIDDRNAVDGIVELVRAEFPLAKLLVRSFDRAHSLKLIGAGVDFEIRETFESAMLFGTEALKALGVSDEDAAETEADVRRRDAERFRMQQAEGVFAGRQVVYGAGPVPTPLTQPKREAKALTEETERVAKSPPVTAGE